MKKTFYDREHFPNSPFWVDRSTRLDRDELITECISKWAALMRLHAPTIAGFAGAACMDASSVNLFFQLQPNVKICGLALTLDLGGSSHYWPQHIIQANDYGFLFYCTVWRGVNLHGRFGTPVMILFRSFTVTWRTHFKIKINWFSF